MTPVIDEKSVSTAGSGQVSSVKNRSSTTNKPATCH
jgi:hypothetical protein